MTRTLIARVSLSTRQQRIYNFLHEHHVGVLSTVTPDNNPHGVVVYYTVGENFVISILTKKGTRKYENLAHNNHAMLTVFDTASQTTVQVTGIARERSGRTNIDEVAGEVLGVASETGHAGLAPIVKLQAGTFTTLRIAPVQIRMAIYARPDPGDYDQLFDSIESFDFKSDF